MFSLIFINCAVVFAIVITTCSCIPRSRINLQVGETKQKHAGNAEAVPRWHQVLFSPLESVEGEFPKRTLRSTSPRRPGTGDIENEKEPVFSHGLSRVEPATSTIPVTDKPNPFLRTKRSTCEVPANLPQMVQDLNTHLNFNQLVGLNPQPQSRNTIIPADQPTLCHHNVTNRWWPREEINLRSTCPWNLTEVDLGEDAFPRYINEATCLCIFCIGSETMECKKINQTVSYLYRQGCQDGLAVMEERNITVTVGCHCARLPIQSGPGSRGHYRPGPLTL